MADASARLDLAFLACGCIPVVGVQTQCHRKLCPFPVLNPRKDGAGHCSYKLLGPI